MSTDLPPGSTLTEGGSKLDETRTSVSVIVPAYGHEAFVEETVRSIAAQTWPNVELIIIEDGSPDRTGEVIESLLPELDIPWRFVRKPNEGLCATLNLGLDLAHGEYVSILASDDTIVPDKIERQVEALATAPGHVAGVYSDMMQMDLEGGHIGVQSLAPPKLDVPQLIARLQGRFPCSVQASLFRAEVLDEVGRFDPEVRIEDADILLKILSRYELSYLPGVVTNYRIVPGGEGSRTRFYVEDVFRIRAPHLDDPRVREHMGRFGKRRLIAGQWLRFAQMHAAYGDDEHVPECARLAAKHWPFAPRIAGYWALSTLHPSLPRRVMDLRRWWAAR